MITNSNRSDKLHDSSLTRERMLASLIERAIVDEDGVATPTTATGRETVRREHDAERGWRRPAA
jgi:hypothetical protein